MTNLKSRIIRLEELVAAVENETLNFEESLYESWVSDPEAFRKSAMEPGRFSGLMRHIMESPIPKKVLRVIARQRRRNPTGTLGPVAGRKHPSQPRKSDPRPGGDGKEKL